MTTRILFVDDSPDMLAVVGKALREDGYAVTSTDSGADALCLLASKPPPDVLILDLAMPQVDGHAVLRQLGPSSPPVVVVTGSEFELADLKSGKVRRVLAKPFGLEDIRSAIRDALSGDADGAMSETKEVPAGGVSVTPDQEAKARERLDRYDSKHSGGS